MQRYTLPTLRQWKAFAEGTRVTRKTVVDRTWKPGSPQPTEPVDGGDRTNPHGLRHVLGNVFEWCLDGRKRQVRKKSGDGTIEAIYAVMAGGGWASGRDWLEKQRARGSAAAVLCPNGWRIKDCGFRVCLVGE